VAVLAEVIPVQEWAVVIRSAAQAIALEAEPAALEAALVIAPEAAALAEAAEAEELVHEVAAWAVHMEVRHHMEAKWEVPAGCREAAVR
jgi:hypothetical protein